MSIELDSLELQVMSSSGRAAAGIDKLASSLSRLKSITKGGAGLTPLKKQLDGLNTALGTFKAENESKLNTVTAALKGLEGCRIFNIPDKERKTYGRSHASKAKER